jgi:carboxyl-terminal processing protease
VAAYYYQAGSIANTLQYDKQMKAAEELLLDTERYRQMLQP